MDIVRMNSELHRLLSFDKFPKRSAVAPEKLAQAGFYYSGSGEDVICFFCGLRNGSWPDRESVVDIHKRLSSQCKLMCDRDAGNVPIRENQMIQDIPSCAISLYGQRDQVTYSSSINDQIIRYPGITDVRPKHPEYALKSERIRSFTEWPSDRVTDPQLLATAGFYYTGMHDCVRCFFCDGGLENWEYGETPWVEHARWFPDCPYVKHCKGVEFVNICQVLTQTSDPLIRRQFTSSSSLKLRMEPGKDRIPEDELIKDLNSVACKIVLSMGYSQGDVEAALSYIRNKYGDVEMKAHLLMKYIRGAMCEIVAAESDCRSHNVAQDAEVGHTSVNEPDIPPPNLVDRHSKDILTAEAVSFAITCMEETERETEQLLEENRRLVELTTCKICLQQEVCILFIPCGHLVSCGDCAERLTRCAVCRAEIQEKVRTYN